MVSTALIACAPITVVDTVIAYVTPRANATLVGLDLIVPSMLALVIALITVTALTERAIVRLDTLVVNVGAEHATSTAIITDIALRVHAIALLASQEIRAKFPNVRMDALEMGSVSTSRVCVMRPGLAKIARFARVRHVFTVSVVMGHATARVGSPELIVPLVNVLEVVLIMVHVLIGHVFVIVAGWARTAAFVDVLRVVT